MASSHCRLSGIIYYKKNFIVTFPDQHITKSELVEDIGVEPMTLCVQGRCSSQLS
jgi:hypothetical protein